jgi:hypothetical protein
MNKNSLNVAIVAVTALLLVFMVLLFISINPWLLYGVTAVLWAITAIVKAINGSSGHHRIDKRGAADQHQLADRGSDAEDGGEPDGAHYGDDSDD